VDETGQVFITSDISTQQNLWNVIQLQQSLIAQLQKQISPTGSVSPFAGSVAPPEWLLCDGSAVDRTLYSQLFAVISTTYGAGDGSTTFNLPDLRGRTVIGSGQGSGLSDRLLGQTVGAETHTLSNSEMPSHSHGGVTGTENQAHVHEEVAVANPNLGGPGHRLTFDGDVTGAFGYPTGCTTGAELSNHNHNIPAEGGNSPHNNMQPSITLNYIIKI